MNIGFMLVFTVKEGTSEEEAKFREVLNAMSYAATATTVMGAWGTLTVGGISVGR